MGSVNVPIGNPPAAGLGDPSGGDGSIILRTRPPPIG
jgi:hypothetical protein